MSTTSFLTSLLRNLILINKVMIMGLFHLSISLQLMLHLLLFATCTSSFASSLDGCESQCGNITIPYPFGLQQGCYLPGFRMSCNREHDPPTLSINTGNINVTLITEDHVHVRSYIARNCYSQLDLGPDLTHIYLDVSDVIPYTISYTRNKFTAVGCDTLAINSNVYDRDYTSGCVAVCRSISAIRNGTCSGVGCCQTQIPQGAKRLDVVIGAIGNHTGTWQISPCSYGFLVDQDEFEFDVTVLQHLYKQTSVPVVLDWAIGEDTCAVATTSANYTCRENSVCVDSMNGPGYRCKCKNGYEGNPYLVDGCRDINECEDLDSNPCIGPCTNTPGGYICSCPKGTVGDGKKAGKGCVKRSSSFPIVQVVLGIGLSFLFVVIIGSWLYWAMKKRRMIVLREKLFKKNGGLLLQQQIASREGVADIFRIFTANELEIATDNYSDTRVLGTGGYGTVYKGILQDKRVVAIKKSKIVDDSQIEQFVNEVVVLSQIIHKNVVRIIGCCLETAVPLLVYEYIPNGSLFDHIHRRRQEGSRHCLPWLVRLRVAAETSSALAYLHAATSRQIIHRDVKSANILLDGNCTAKVADFGASRLIPLGRAEVMTMVQGTLGYLDPEYFQSGLLTEKSDVYSFGVVLSELLTGELPLTTKKVLATNFLDAIRNDRLFQIVDVRVQAEGSRDQILLVAELAARCMRIKGDERPTMTEVAAELERCWRAEKKRQPSQVEATIEVENARSAGEPSHTMFYSLNGSIDDNMEEEYFETAVYYPS